MSSQLAIAATASLFALSAVALLSPGSARVHELPARMGATVAMAAAPSEWLKAPELLPAPSLTD